MRKPTLCYSFPLHGDTSPESIARRRTRVALLSELRGGGYRSADLRRLLFGDLPALWHGPRIFRRTRNRIMDPVPILPDNDASLSDSGSADSGSAGSNPSDAKPSLVRGLGPLDSVLLLVSGIIGSSIFLTAKDIAGPLPQPVLFLLVWLLGALISLCACFAFAELGSMFPASGGQYIYLREAYGDLIAFLYGWMLFSVANGGTIAALSVASAAYAGQVFPIVSQDHVVLSLFGIVVTRAHLLALVLIAVVTYVNVVGLRWGT